jgi:hypothetical protein
MSTNPYQGVDTSLVRVNSRYRHARLSGLVWVVKFAAVHGSWVVGCGLWVVGYVLRVVGLRLWVVGCGLWVMFCGLWVMGCLWVPWVLAPLRKVVEDGLGCRGNAWVVDGLLTPLYGAVDTPR